MAGYPNLKLQIWRTGMRQNKVAQMAGLDEPALSRMVNGFRKPSPDLKKRIANILSADEDWLFEEQPCVFAGRNGEVV